MSGTKALEEGRPQPEAGYLVSDFLDQVADRLGLGSAGS